MASKADMQILIVEDDFVARGFLEKMVQTEGHDCILADDGRQAWDLFLQKKPRVVITDWMMPGMDGPTLCAKIRESNASHYVYTILLSARGDKSDLITGLKAGADDYIMKPFDPEELRTRIRFGQRIIQLEDKFKKAQLHLIQSEKMAPVGQLAAGVAHEINNPTGFISSNLKTLSDYQADLNGLIRQYRQLVGELNECAEKEGFPTRLATHLNEITSLEKDVEIDFVLNDITDLIKDCTEGTNRIKKIVLSLKDFAHPGEDKLQEADINQGIESTLNVVWNELKHNATVKKEYGDLPLVMCYPQQLNQVIMNLLVNASQALQGKAEIGIVTRADGGRIEIRVSDTGCGIPPENLSKIFDPFFTTKEVGKGTGLGLNVAYNIVEKHKGTINVESEVGKGTTFTIRIPVD
jgi:two-component system NtrC family sensor kinase